MEFTEKEFEDSLEIMKALRNLVQFQNILSTTSFMRTENLSLICQFLKFRDQDVVIAEEERRVKAMSSVAFDLLRIVLDKGIENFSFLISNLEFTRTLTRCIHKHDRKIFDREETVKMHQILTKICQVELEQSSDHDYPSLKEKFFIKSGLVMFMLSYLLDREYPQKERR